MYQEKYLKYKNKYIYNKNLIEGITAYYEDG